MRTLEQDIQLIQKELSQWHLEDAYCLPDVPREMKVDPDSDEEWCDWKMLLSTYTRNDILLLETKLPAPLPQFFRAYILSYHVMDFDFGEYTFPGLKIGQTLEKNLSELLDDSYWNIGFISIGSGRGCGDPIVMDFMSPTDDGDYPVSIFNHDFVPRDCWQDRKRLQSYNSIVACSFREYFLGLLRYNNDMFPAPLSPEELRKN